MLIEFLRLLWNRNEIKLKSIDWSTTGLSTESLEKRGSETGWIGECSDLEVIRNTLKSPGVEELISSFKIGEPSSQWLQREVSESPGNWNLVLIESVKDILEVWRNDDETLDTFGELVQTDNELIK